MKNLNNQEQKDSRTEDELEMEGYMEHLEFQEWKRRKAMDKEIAGVSDSKPEKKIGRIYLKFNNAHVRGQCAISGESFKPDIPLAFFLNNDYGLPVTPEIAFERGFTLDSKDFAELGTMIFRDNSKDTAENQNNMVTVNLSLPACMKIYMELDELFNIGEMKTEGTKTDLWELYDFRKHLQDVIFSILRSTKEFKHRPIILKEQPPIDYSIPF